ncbi:MAG TPA: hypothetical protein VNW46_18285 [Gemmatimonadaceae bacterium]|jgi:hypothetical protein|nr:hypothetical protein [Gemmatimonadaceae bacterium]
MTPREFIRPRGALASRLAAVALTASLFGLGACNESFVPNYNYLSALSVSQGGVDAAMNGTYNARSDAGNWATWSSGFGREATYFTFSESRFVTELTGVSFPQSTDFIGTTVWDVEFQSVKTADSAEKIVEELVAGGASAAGGEASWGALETGKALAYMYAAESRDSLGVPINAVGQTKPPFAPILCNQLVWAQIVAMLDSAADSLTAAGAGTSIPGTLPAGLAQVGGSAGSFQSLTFSLRAKARVEYAYAIVRQAGGPVLAPLTNAAAVAQLDSAKTDITNSTVIYSTTLSPSEAVPAADPGAFFTFSTLSNDVVNPIFGFIKGYYALVPYVNGIGSGIGTPPGSGPNSPVDTADLRWKAKFSFVISNGVPFIPGSANPQLSSSWNYRNNLTGSTPLPIIRNVELQFIMARAQLGLGDLAGAVTTINNVRTGVGHVAPLTPALTFASVASFIITEARLTFIAEGTGEDIMPTRDYGLESTYMITAGPSDFQWTTLPIPIEESSPRNGDVTPVCTGAAAHTAPAPKAVKVAPKGRTTIRLH